MKLLELISKTRASRNHKVLFQSEATIHIKRNFSQTWIVHLKNGRFDYAHKQMGVSKKISSVNALVRFLHLP
jgi:hypothetical protein